MSPWVFGLFQKYGAIPDQALRSEQLCDGGHGAPSHQIAFQTGGLDARRVRTGYPQETAVVSVGFLYLQNIETNV